MVHYLPWSFLTPAVFDLHAGLVTVVAPPEVKLAQQDIGVRTGLRSAWSGCREIVMDSWVYQFQE